MNDKVQIDAREKGKSWNIAGNDIIADQHIN